MNGKQVLALIIIASFGIAFVVTPMPVLADKYAFAKAVAKQILNLIINYRGVLIVSVPFFIMMMGIVRFLKNRQPRPALA